MTSKQTLRKRIFKSGLAMLLLGATLGITGFASAPAAAGSGDGEVTICHRTNAPSNPYRIITVAFSGTDGSLQGPDHTGHDGPAFDYSALPSDSDYPYTTPRNGDQWGDIIPPYGDSYPGKNWPVELNTPEEIAEFLATGCGGSTGCETDCNPAGRLTLEKVTDGPGEPQGAETTLFDFSVECLTDNDDAVPDETPSLTPDDGETDVATGLDSEETCTVGETTTSTAFSTSYSVDGDAVDAVDGLVSVAFTSADQVISVVVTNTYPCPTGQTPNDEDGCESTTSTGDLSVDKVVTGNNQPPAATEFSLTVACTSDEEAVDLGTQASFTLTAAEAAEVLSGIPTGATCTVTETNAQGATATTITVGGGTASSGTSVQGVTIGDDTTVAVVVTNAFNTSGGCTQNCGQIFDECPLIAGNQPAGTDCDPPPPPPLVDECPDDLGLQTNPDQCSVPEVIAPEVITPEVQVAGIQLVKAPTAPVAVAAAQLPRTGTDTIPMLQLGLGLIILGVGALVFGREQTATA